MEVRYFCLNCKHDKKCKNIFCRKWEIQQRLKAIRESGLAYKPARKKGGRPKNPELSPEDKQARAMKRKERNREACRKYLASLTPEQLEERKRKHREYNNERYRKLHPESTGYKKLTPEERKEKNRQRAREYYHKNREKMIEAVYKSKEKRLKKMSPEEKKAYKERCSQYFRDYKKKKREEKKCVHGE